MVAQIAVETGIPPSALMEDFHMLRAIIAVMNERAKKVH
jgi:hypothetical protein